MNMLISELQMLAGDWRTWIVVALMAAVALHSVVVFAICPYVHGKANITDEAVVEARNAPFNLGLRFGFMMVSGIAMTITGLFMIAEGVHPTLGLAIVVAGLVIIQTEPTRAMIRDNTHRLVANRDAEPMTFAAVQSRLRGSHRELVTANLIMLTALVAGILAFS